MEWTAGILGFLAGAVSFLLGFFWGRQSHGSRPQEQPCQPATAAVQDPKLMKELLPFLRYDGSEKVWGSQKPSADPHR